MQLARKTLGEHPGYYRSEIFTWRSPAAFPIQSSTPGKTESVSYHASVIAALGEGSERRCGQGFSLVDQRKSFLSFSYLAAEQLTEPVCTRKPGGAVPQQVGLST